MGSGRLQYTVPSLSEILSGDIERFAALETVTFTLGLRDPQDDNEIKCAVVDNCRFVMTRSMTPVLAYLSPRVVYDGADMAFYVDPKSSQNYKTSTETYFTEARINS